MTESCNKRIYNIIVPVYRELVLSDKVSIRALFRIMKSKCDIWFIIPDCSQNVRSNLVTFVESEFGAKVDKDFYIKTFDKKYFESKFTYSSLLLTSEFYQFWYSLGYEKSFIYQTDCYLFRDEFDYWAQKPYTYVGAPILATNSDWGYYGGYVGNGGFSMRDNKVLSNILNRENDFWKEHKSELGNTKLAKHNSDKYINYEDIFICRLLSRYTYIDLPSAKEAAKFAYDRNPAECANVYGVKCPMCAHNFMLLANYWKQFIPELNEDSELFSKELYDGACNIIENWNKMDHPESYGKQCAGY